MTDTNVGSDFKKVIDASAEKMRSIKEQRDTKVTATPRNLLFAAIAVSATFMAGLFMFQIIAGMFAIMMAVVFGIVSFLAIKHLRTLDVVVAQKMKNLVLELQMKEAQKNNIFQLQNLVLDRKRQLSDGIKARGELGGFLESLKLRVSRADKEKDSFYGQKVAMLDKVTKAFANNKIMLDKAKVSVGDFEDKVTHYKEMVEFTKIADKFSEILGDNHLEEMLSLEAFNTIETEFCTAMSQLDVSVEFSED